MPDVIEKDTVVSIHYALTDEAGNALDSSREREPLAYLHGNNNIIPGLENALSGKAAGDSLTVTVTPAEAYGEIDETLIQSVPRAAFEGVEDIEPGMTFRTSGPDGNARHVVVKAVDGENVTIDANHQLAGRTLVFDVEVIAVRAARKDEIAHGHAHPTP